MRTIGLLLWIFVSAAFMIPIFVAAYRADKKRAKAQKATFEQKKEEPRVVQAQPVIKENSDVLSKWRDVIDELKAQTKQPVFRLKVNLEHRPTLLESKFGGVPYWDISKPYPIDAEGDKMMLLAQFNCEEIKDQRLPSTGILQFFISCDDSYLHGMNLDDLTIQTDFRVIYHEIIQSDADEQTIMELGIPTSELDDYKEYSPVTGCIAVDIIHESESISLTDYRFDTLFIKIAQSKGFEIADNLSVFNLLSSDEYTQLYNEFDGTGSKLMGYPYFTQEDPRSYKDDLERYDTLLFQMDSEHVKEIKRFVVMWGDIGVANFFINHEDLESKNFNHVMYTWDCG